MWIRSPAVRPTLRPFRSHPTLPLAVPTGAGHFRTPGSRPAPLRGPSSLRCTHPTWTLAGLSLWTHRTPQSPPTIFRNLIRATLMPRLVLCPPVSLSALFVAVVRSIWGVPLLAHPTLLRLGAHGCNAVYKLPVSSGETDVIVVERSEPSVEEAARAQPIIAHARQRRRRE